MDKSLRNTLRNTVTHCRRLLEEAIAELLQGQFGIHLDGKIEDAASLSHLSEEDREYRAQILVHLQHIQAGGQGSRGAGGQGSRGAGVKKPSTRFANLPTFQPSKETVAQLIREVAFTHLNRLAAYKMMETRGLIRESVSRGVKSQGFLFYLADHSEDEKLWSSGQQERAYRHFLTWLGGTLSQEIGVLFSPDDPANRLLPPQRVLDQVLDLLNSADLAAIWAEDETIGWIYQYFTPKELRDQARSESQAPRNSYELAFRNQFYTPRYVVQFLTDNTLGRIWYEMRRGETRLAEVCQYLVRRPNEVFLREGEQGSRGAEEQGGEETNGEAASSEIVNRKSKIVNPVYIPFRAKKDPRDLKILDPASGSGHFLLYCFDLLEIIYEEAYADPDLGLALQADYPTLAEFKQAIPALILRHNLHGIDIDPRAVQIASLALWLRAVSSDKWSVGSDKWSVASDKWSVTSDKKTSLATHHSSLVTHHSPLVTHHSPLVTKMNLVCAEPMPGNAALLDEFTADLQPPLLGQLLRAIVGKMELAGEAGSLLKIEEEIDDALAAAKKQWLAGPKPEQLSFFPQEKKPEQLSMFDLTGISDELFWDEAEGRLLAALRDYAEHASGEAGLARRLFADDTARGFAFINLCRQRFDVLLMNPPYGEPTTQAKTYLVRQYPDTHKDIYSAFYERSIQLTKEGSYIGALTSRTFLQNNSFIPLREKILLPNAIFKVTADLGLGVLDDALVETCATVFARNMGNILSYFIRLQETDNKSFDLQMACSGNTNDIFYQVTQDEFRRIEGSPITYWLPKKLRNLLENSDKFSIRNVANIRQGLATGDDFRFIRAWWEIESDQIGRRARWQWLSKGGDYAPWFFSIHLLVDWENDGYAIRNFTDEEGREKSRYRGFDQYFKPGLTYPFRTVKGFNVRVLPAECIFTVQGPSIVVNEGEPLLQMLAYLNSDVCKVFLQSLTSTGAWQVGYVQLIPFVSLESHIGHEIETYALENIETLRQIDETDETSPYYQSPPFPFKEIFSVVEEEINLRNKIVQKVSDNKAKVDEIYAANINLPISELRYLSAIGLRETIDIENSGVYEVVDSSIHRFSSLDFTQSIVSYLLGVVFGRWDMRVALMPSLPPKWTDPFHPLPTCSPGMLVGPDGLPATSGRIASEEWLRARPNAISLPPPPPQPSPESGEGAWPTIPDSEYPLAVDWDGLLVDDPDHPDDLLHRVREVLELLWPDRAEAIEQEANEILGVKDLRAYFRNPGSGGFWLDHVKRYSKSRRKAPIYWLLQSSRKNYALWLYYHRLDKDILYKALVNYVEPKIRLEESKLEGIRGQLRKSDEWSVTSDKQKPSRHSPLVTRHLERDLDQQESFVAELHDFRDKLRRAAGLNLEPDLNDGVVLNIAPLWELVPWKEARQYWEELLAGKYEGSSVGRQLREKGVVK